MVNPIRIFAVDLDTRGIHYYPSMKMATYYMGGTTEALKEALEVDGSEYRVRRKEEEEEEEMWFVCQGDHHHHHHHHQEAISYDSRGNHRSQVSFALSYTPTTTTTAGLPCVYRQ